MPGLLQQYATVFNGPEATLLALVLVAFCLLLLGIELLLRGNRRRARVGSGAAGDPVRIRLGRLQLPVVAILGAFALWALAVPLVSLVRWLVRGTSTSVDLGGWVRRPRRRSGSRSPAA